MKPQGAGEGAPAAGVMLSATMRWILALLVVSLGYHLAFSDPVGGGWTPLQIIAAVTRHSAILLPFAAFAGGLAGTSGRHGTSLVFGVVLAAVVYSLSALAVPLAEFAASREAGNAVSERYPYGPSTPVGLVRTRRHVSANPPDEYSLSTQRPLQRPPNWLLMLLLQPVTLAGFALLNVLNGLGAAGVTSGLSPPARANSRWAIGLFGGLAFFLVLAVADDWVQSSPDASAVAASFLPLLVPLAELGLLHLIRRRPRNLHAPSNRGVL